MNEWMNQEASLLVISYGWSDKEVRKKDMGADMRKRV